MRIFSRIAATAFAGAIAAVSTLPAAQAYYSPFSRYFDESPDFVIEQAYQYEDSDTFFVRVCNRGDTPGNGGTLNVSVGRSNYDREERSYSGLTPAAGSCSNFELTNVRQYGRKSSRTYGLTASVAWYGAAPETSLTNNSKNIPASPTMRSGGAVSSSWSSSNSATRNSYQDPVSDLYLDRNGTNPYAGRTWYYSNGGSYVCGGYWDNGSNSWRPYSRYYSNYASDDHYYDSGRGYSNYGNYPYSYSSSSHCYDKYVPGTSGYYWNGSSSNSYYNGSPYYSNNGTHSNGYYYRDDNTVYDPTSNRYYTQNQYSNPNFYVARLGRDGGARNVLATVCNNGADMSGFKDLTIMFSDLSRNTSFRATQYVKLLSGQCRDVSVNFTSFSANFSGYHTFEAYVDSDNRFSERDENDNKLKADVWVSK